MSDAPIAVDGVPIARCGFAELLRAMVTGQRVEFRRGLSTDQRRRLVAIEREVLRRALDGPGPSQKVLI